jgi:hypothetical protein
MGALIASPDQTMRGFTPRILRDLGPDEIARYSFQAMTTWGGTDDFRHFLRRIFELISADGGRSTVPEAVFGKLSYGQWETRPPDERQAITSFFETLRSNVLDHFPHAFAAEASLRCIAQVANDMARYLGRWRIAQSRMRSISPRLLKQSALVAPSWLVLGRYVERAAGAGKAGGRLAARSRLQDRK